MRRREQPAWYRCRGYVHFDARLTEIEAINLVTNPDKVSRHAFWPLLGYSSRERRWGKAKKKFGDKKRPIAYASHADAHIFAYYAELLAKPYEETLALEKLQEIVLAYRKHGSSGDRGKANYDFAADAFSEICERSNCDAIAIDISKFFDKLPHGELKKQWKKLLGRDELPRDHYSVYRAATSFSVVPLRQARNAFCVGLRKLRKLRRLPISGRKFREKIRDAGLIMHNSNSFGIPQGLPISGLLANLCMLEFDVAVRDFCALCGASYRRYSDDILVISPLGNGESILGFLKTQLKKLGLDFQEDKTVRAEFRAKAEGTVRANIPLQYLGFTFDGEHVRVRPQTQVRFLKRMHRAVIRARNAARRNKQLRIRRRDLFMRYSHLGPHHETSEQRKPRGTFFAYVNRSESALSREVLREKMVVDISRQLRRSWNQLLRRMKKADLQLVSSGG